MRCGKRINLIRDFRLRDLPGTSNQRVSSLAQRVPVEVADLLRYSHPGHLQLRVRVWIVEEASVGWQHDRVSPERLYRIAQFEWASRHCECAEGSRFKIDSHLHVHHKCQQ